MRTVIISSIQHYNNDVQHFHVQPHADCVKSLLETQHQHSLVHKPHRDHQVKVDVIKGTYFANLLVILCWAFVKPLVLASPPLS